MTEPAFGWSEGIATAALVVSLLTAYRQHALNKVLLDQANAADAALKRARVSAKLVDDGRGFRLRVFNNGPAIARNVTLDFSECADLLDTEDIDDKLPLDMEPHQSVSLLALVTFGTQSKYKLTLRWDDDSGKGNSAPVYVTI